MFEYTRYNMQIISMLRHKMFTLCYLINIIKAHNMRFSRDTSKVLNTKIN